MKAATSAARTTRVPAPLAEILPRMRIGPYELGSNVVLAPMAGVTDRPFRVIANSSARDSRRQK